MAQIAEDEIEWPPCEPPASQPSGHPQAFLADKALSLQSAGGHFLVEGAPPFSHSASQPFSQPAGRPPANKQTTCWTRWRPFNESGQFCARCDCANELENFISSRRAGRPAGNINGNNKSESFPQNRSAEGSGRSGGNLVRFAAGRPAGRRFNR